MSGEKKYPATPKKRQEARRKGQVFKSQEAVAALMLIAFVGILYVWLPRMVEKLTLIFPYIFSLSTEWDLRSVSTLASNMLWLGIQVVGPVFLVGFLVALGVNYYQVGVLFTTEVLKPQLSRISLLSGAKRMFGAKAWVNLIKSLIKLVIIGYFVFATVRDRIQVYPAMMRLEIGQTAILLGEALWQMAWKIAAAFTVIVIIDYVYERWDYEQNLKMTHEELKQEHKDTEGNPELKGEIKRKQRALSMTRMMHEMKQADVVVTNPMHLAVALRYDPKIRKEPFVVAKGQDFIALRMRELAKEYGLVIVENKPLARALFNQVELGQSIPEELYKAVAEVLAFVYRLKKKRA